jgi:cytidylate kinase
MKILVFGNSGSGKSTYAKSLVAQFGLAHLDLDAIVWEPGKIAVQREAKVIAASLNLETAVGRTRVCFFWASRRGVTTQNTHCLQGGTTKSGSPKNVQSCS